MSAPKVFISYSHRDEAWKDRLVLQLRVLELEGDLTVWDDRKIAAGAGWQAEIEAAMNSAQAAVLLISADFLGSSFIRGEEVPRLLKRRAENGLRVIPLIVHPCPWQAVSWLAPIQCRPKDGRPLSKGRRAKVDEDLAALALEIRNLLQSPSPRPAAVGATAVLPVPAVLVAPSNKAVALWQEKLSFLLEQEVLVVDPAQKFSLRKQIEEAKEKLRELNA